MIQEVPTHERLRIFGPATFGHHVDDHPGAVRCAGPSHEHDKGKGHEDLLVLLSIVIRGRAIRTGCSVNLVSEP